MKTKKSGGDWASSNGGATVPAQMRASSKQKRDEFSEADASLVFAGRIGHGLRLWRETTNI